MYFYVFFQRVKVQYIFYIINTLHVYYLFRNKILCIRATALFFVFIVKREIP